MRAAVPVATITTSIPIPMPVAENVAASSGGGAVQCISTRVQQLRTRIAQPAQRNPARHHQLVRGCRCGGCDRGLVPEGGIRPPAGEALRADAPEQRLGVEDGAGGGGLAVDKAERQWARWSDSGRGGATAGEAG